jgi:hypothetical protein
MVFKHALMWCGHLAWISSIAPISGGAGLDSLSSSALRCPDSERSERPLAQGKGPGFTG